MANAMRLPCDILMYLSYLSFLSYCNPYSRQAVLIVHVLYCKINLSIYLPSFLGAGVIHGISRILRKKPPDP